MQVVQVPNLDPRTIDAWRYPAAGRDLLVGLEEAMIHCRVHQQMILFAVMKIKINLQVLMEMIS